MYLWLTSSDRSDVVSPRHDLVWSQACLVYDRTCCWFHLMGFLIWGFIMFSWYVVEMTWDCWTRLFTCRLRLIELIYSRKFMFLPARR